ncbi:hypothetical protein ELE36_06115 [Pseudolysobacter antarcticus]|uniref:Uncharacterized protein n=1 Tax=Pseudolysobacter antarcticus TaxID=2511995 RepID=A0A411HHU5_9GAMM|nr:hypothetical protein [Pseudolysobacter antarcticus]QBB69970.1 hypothetical protein ELE36_06115 [Pseudolysobacter antarcticus]
MASPRRSKKSPAPQKNGARAKAPAVALPRWRWPLYLAIAAGVFSILFVKIGVVIPDQYLSLAAWQDSDGLTRLVGTTLFTALIMALIKLFLDQVLLGIAQRKSTLSIAGDLAISMAKVAAGVVVEGVIDAAASSASGGDSGSGEFKGGGGSFGGGGASGDF